MNSCLYECHVVHARFLPRAHRFVYRIFLFAVDLDELGGLPKRFAPFSVNRANLYSFRDADYLPIDERMHGISSGTGVSPVVAAHGRDARATSSPELKTRVAAYLAHHG
ncbi:MAG: DUF1365 family protein, partial [Opitutaceae bacterium]